MRIEVVDRIDVYVILKIYLSTPVPVKYSLLNKITSFGTRDTSQFFWCRCWLVQCSQASKWLKWIRCQSPTLWWMSTISVALCVKTYPPIRKRQCCSATMEPGLPWLTPTRMLLNNDVIRPVRRHGCLIWEIFLDLHQEFDCKTSILIKTHIFRFCVKRSRVHHICSRWRALDDDSGVQSSKQFDLASTVNDVHYNPPERPSQDVDWHNAVNKLTDNLRLDWQEDLSVPGDSFAYRYRFIGMFEYSESMWDGNLGSIMVVQHWVGLNEMVYQPTHFASYWDSPKTMKFEIKREIKY